MASALSFPARRNSPATPALPVVSETSPVIIAINSGDMPLYGTCRRSRPSMLLRYSNSRCGCEPRVAVGRRAIDGFCSDGAARAGAVFDDHRGAPSRTEVLSGSSDDQIDSASRRERDYKADKARGIVI